MRRSRIGLLVSVALLAAAASTAAEGATVSRDEPVVVSDGAVLQATLTGEAPLAARPTIVEFSPYGRASGTLDAGTAFNHLLVQIRGTGDSHGAFDVLGPRTQADVVDVLGWACRQPWSDGTLGLNGFSASAITIYNALHLELPCVRAAVLKSGTHELYRDLLAPGGVSNIVPGAVVLAGIGGIALSQGLERDPATYGDAIMGILRSGTEVLRHPTLDDWWRERGWRGNANRFPVLTVAGFYDVESRGAFEGFRALRAHGAHLVVIGAHDAHPAGTDGGLAEMRAWMDRYVRGVRNGVEDRPRVQMWLSDGDRASYAAGRFVQRDASDWPVPGTMWRSLYLDPARSGTAGSLNDGTLADRPPVARGATQSYPAVPSIPTMTDVPNAAIIDAGGGSAATDAMPILSDMSVAEPLGLSYTTAPLPSDLEVVGPAALELELATTAPRAAIWAVVSDVAPGKPAKPLGIGRLSTDYPDTDPERDLTDRDGTVVQPYGRYDLPRPARPGRSRRYRIELWPLGNRFKAGHRLRLHLVGSSSASVPDLPGINTVTVGASRLVLPVLGPAPSPRTCRSRRIVTVISARRYRRVLRSAVAQVAGRTVARLRAGRGRVDLRGRPRGVTTVRLVMHLQNGRRVTEARRFRLCASRRRR